MTVVTITEEPLALEDLLAIVDGARVHLADSTRAVIAASRAVVDLALARNDAVYGLTTQVGHGKDTLLTEEEIRSEQLFLVKSHSGGIGPPLPTQRFALLWPFASTGSPAVDPVPPLRSPTCWRQC